MVKTVEEKMRIKKIRKIKIEYQIIKNYDNDNDSNDKVSLVEESEEDNEG